MHYEIDFSINGKWHHTCGESSFPTDENFAKNNYSNDDLIWNSRTIIDGYMKMENIVGNVDEGSITCRVSQQR